MLKKIIKMKKLLFTVAVLFFCKLSNAQDGNPNTNVVPQSPTVASFSKYIDFPVSLYTGQAEVSVPVYNMKVGDIEVPVNLQYHTGGVKVEDIGSFVGLNWSLNAGGTITRVINGNPDGTSQFYYEKPPFIYSVQKKQMYEASGYPGPIDTEHDYFYFTAGQYSGKYVIDWLDNQKPVLFPVQDVKIEYSNANSNGAIRITTPDGLIYTYGKVETNVLWLGSCWQLK
jgi:hypothetical protein